jgi:hypothetical protein
MKMKNQPDFKLPVFDGRCPSITDWAQMAAYLDGEGSILINTQKRGNGEVRGWYLRIMVANSDVRLMAWLKERFGGVYRDANTEKYYAGKNWKISYHWTIGAFPAAWILHNSLPYFVIKREQAEIGITLQESMRLFVNGSGDKKLPKELYEQRKELKRRLLVLKARGKVMEPAQAQRIADVS